MHRPNHHHRAFTLVELLVSIAIALLLIIGVNTVFKVTSQTVGAGNSLLNANRDARTVFQTFLTDLNNVDAVPSAGSTTGDAPFFVIRSEHVYAFRNAMDQQTATNPTDPATDTKLFSAFANNACPVTLMHFRSHRIDRLGFFSRGVFARQTTSDGSRFVSTTTGGEAYVYYGHSQQPTSASAAASGAAWSDPGSGIATNNTAPAANPNNYYASDWMLSRMATILIPTPATSEQNYLPDKGGLSPLNVGPIATPWASTSIAPTTDLAATSIANYNAHTRPSGIQSYSYAYTPANPPSVPKALPGSLYGQDWWDPVIDMRYRSSPFVLSGANFSSTQAKITPAALALCAPDLIRGCSQFIVEYAGNFYTKDVNGKASSNLSDGKTPQTVPTPDATGQLDFVLVNGVRQIRWYGYPRSTSGGTSVTAATGDVVPLRDVLAWANSAWIGPHNNGLGTASTTGPTPGFYADAERFSPAFPTATAGLQDYWSHLSAANDKSPALHYVYSAAWGPDVQYQAFPKMIRIIIEVDDHEGRLKQPQRYEFVYDVQQ